MGPANNGGLGASGGAVLVTAIVVAVVLIMIEFGGGLTKPLYAPPHTATAQATMTQATG
jgi:hypothetical protein